MRDLVGETLAGKYAVEAIVGRGGMGVVLAARHIELDERVAIKLVLNEDGATSPEFVTRFLREARLAIKIKSEHVVRVTDVARLDTGEPYIVMELLEGQDLSELLASAGPLSVPAASLYVLQACEAIGEAHALGIVHRDLKPANLFLTTRRDGSPCIKVLDFGISKMIGAPDAHSVTKTNTLMGSPLYMSPDQLVQSRDVDARSDVWALGVILFELLTQRCPFEADEAPALIAQILHSPPQSLRSLRPDAPPELEALINAALVKDRSQRIPDVGEFARLLAPFAPDVGRFSVERIAAVFSRSGNATSPPPSATTPQSWGHASANPVVVPSSAGAATASPPEAKRSLRSLFMGLAALGLVAMAVGLWFAFESGRSAQPADAESTTQTSSAERGAPPPLSTASSALEASPAAPSVVTELPVPSAAAADSAIESSASPAKSRAPATRNTARTAVPGAQPKGPTSTKVDPFGGVR
jgi:eukaryotic-like serine/threonine-protein kinase